MDSLKGKDATQLEYTREEVLQALKELQQDGFVERVPRSRKKWRAKVGVMINIDIPKF